MWFSFCSHLTLVSITAQFRRLNEHATVRRLRYTYAYWLRVNFCFHTFVILIFSLCVPICLNYNDCVISRSHEKNIEISFTLTALLKRVQSISHKIKLTSGQFRDMLLITTSKILVIKCIHRQYRARVVGVEFTE